MILKPKREIMFKKNKKLLLVVYTYTNYAWSTLDKKFVIDYCTFLRGNIVTWRKKNKI